ncbi:hypothetical protein HHI36_008032 [Cryptolaemus montrouzieri]|uniref:Uncharacterized protein n=1 Tax=Cryptolaemus montrouzieri TaxID=559131 RepID=A0ABD2MS72_9CUCU
MMNKMLDFSEDQRGQLVNGEELAGVVSLTNNQLNVIHLNIRSVRKNFDNLLLLFQAYYLFFCDVIVLSKCFQINSAEEFNIPGFTFFYAEGCYNRNDGVIIFGKSSIHVEVVHVKLPTSGATVSRMSFKFNNISYGITATYKPPPIWDRGFIQDLLGFLEANNRSNIVIFRGAINIDILDRKVTVLKNILLEWPTLALSHI